MKLKSFGMKSHPKRYENTLIEGMKLHSKGMKWCRRYEKIPIIPRYETDAQGMKQMHKVWNRCTRYEKCAQGIKQLHKGMKCFFKVWNKCFLEKQWFFIPLWVCFIPFWVWKYRLFFPDGGKDHPRDRDVHTPGLKDHSVAHICHVREGARGHCLARTNKMPCKQGYPARVSKVMTQPLLPRVRRSTRE